MISVILPVHNGELYLAEALESIRANQGFPLEILVIDDGSSDGSASLAQSFPQVRYFRQEQAGPGAARHRGLQEARGQWVGFLDADDRWTSDKLAVQMEYLQLRPEVAGVFGAVRQFISPDLSPTEAGQLRCDPAPSRGQLPGSFLMRREVYDLVGPMSSTYQVGEFIDWCMRAQERGCHFADLNQVVLERRLHRSNLGRRQRDSRQDYARIAMAALRRRRQAGSR